jgi:chromosome segregation ATPase
MRAHINGISAEVETMTAELAVLGAVRTEEELGREREGVESELRAIEGRVASGIETRAIEDRRSRDTEAALRNVKDRVATLEDEIQELKNSIEASEVPEETLQQARADLNELERRYPKLWGSIRPLATKSGPLQVGQKTRIGECLTYTHS